MNTVQSSTQITSSAPAAAAVEPARTLSRLLEPRGELEAPHGVDGNRFPVRGDIGISFFQRKE